MTQTYEVKARQTIEAIGQLLEAGIRRISVIVRHSERFFTKDAAMEPFMGLTDTGKHLAVDFGASLPSTPLPRLSSSFLGRCIETAFLIDKGFTQKNQKDLDHNITQDLLAPFYIKDMENAVVRVKKEGIHPFLRNWFDRKIEKTIMDDPETTAERLSQFMIEQIKSLEQNQIAICVSHDWNLFCLKEIKLGLAHENFGDVGYLEGLVFFEKNKKYYLTSHQTDPIPL